MYSPQLDFHGNIIVGAAQVLFHLVVVEGSLWACPYHLRQGTEKPKPDMIECMNLIWIRVAKTRCSTFILDKLVFMVITTIVVTIIKFRDWITIYILNPYLSPSIFYAQFSILTDLFHFYHQVDYVTTTKRRINGVATGQMAVTELRTRLPIFVRRSQFKLPTRPTVSALLLLGVYLFKWEKHF